MNLEDKIIELKIEWPEAKPTELPGPSLPETELGLEAGMIMTEPDAESTETEIVPEAVPAAESPVETGADEAAPATTEESE